MIVDYLGYALQRRGPRAVVVMKDGIVLLGAVSFDAGIAWIERQEGRTGLATLRTNISEVTPPDGEPPHAA